MIIFCADLVNLVAVVVGDTFVYCAGGKTYNILMST